MELSRRQLLPLPLAAFAAGQPSSGRALKIVCAGGHPDDPESGCGGALARYSELGHHVTIIYLTRGEAGIPGTSHEAAAAIRSAECAGANAVVLPERRAAGVNATVRKASAGATAHLPIARVANVAGALRTLKKAGVWIAGAAAAPDAVDYTKADLRGDVALVIGAEGDGISPVVRKECDYVVRIPMFGTLGSLNASVAAGVLLFEVRRQRGAEG